MKPNSVFILFAFLILSLNSCKSQEKDILGKWEPNTETRHFYRIEFFKDGTISMTKTLKDSRVEGVGDYKFVDESHIRIKTKFSEAVFEHLVVAKTLELKDGEGIASKYTKADVFKPLPVVVSINELKNVATHLRDIGTRLEMYAVDNNKYPNVSGSVKNLKPILEPVYISSLPVKDKWGNDYNYFVADNLQKYWIIWYGSDNKPDANIYDSNGFPINAEAKTSSPDQDIIFSEGLFIRYPAEF